MRRRLILIAAAAVLAPAALAIGHGGAAATPAAPASGPPDHAKIIAARHAGFKLSLASFLGIKAALARGDDVKTLALPASAIAGWGRVIPTMFPAGSAGAGSEALPAVWSDPAGFAAASAAMTDAASKLAMLAKAGDTAGAAAQFGELGKTCGGCHMKFRVEEKK